MSEKKSIWMSALIAVVVTFALLAPSAALAEGSPVKIKFSAKRTHLEAGQCTQLKWSVKGGFVVLLDGEPVDHKGKKKVCPVHTQHYELAVDTGEDMEMREVMIHIGEGSEPPAEPQPGVTINFRADRTQLNAGGCTHLRWDVEHAKEVYLDGQGVVGHSARQVCPANTRSYVLRVDHKGGSIERQVTIHVSGGGGGAPAPQNPGTPVADLAVTDLYADTLPQGAIWMRVTNHGPAALNNTPIQIKCNAQGQPTGNQIAWTHVESPWLHTVNLQPGQTATFQTKITVDTSQYSYNVTCSVSVPQGAAFTDPKNSNNSYSEAVSSPRKVDLAVTDLYPVSQPQGKLWLRVTNNGPAALNHGGIQLSCTGTATNYATGAKSQVSAPAWLTVLTASPGQTQNFETPLSLETNKYWYEITCTVVAFGAQDANPGNDSHTETLPPPP